MQLPEAKEKFIQSWGTLGSNWGINRTMSQIHALLIVAKEPMSAEEIMEELKISRGNANMNLRALLEWGLVSKKLVPGERKEYFEADKDVWQVARKIAKERSRREIEPALEVLESVSKVEGSDAETEEFRKVTAELSDFTHKVESLSGKFVRSDRNWFYRTLLRLVT